MANQSTPPAPIRIMRAGTRSVAGPDRPGFIGHRHLIYQLTRREILGRYRGSYLGLLWPFLNPLFQLGIYTVVFRYIFRARFGGRLGESQTDFALMLFAGLIVFNAFAECIARAPTLIRANANYVTRVVFPLEILPVTIVLSSLFHLLLSFVPLLLLTALLKGHLSWTAFGWPLLLLPLLAFNLGLAWLLAAGGAFVRDLSEAVLALTTILLYASAVFYPLSLVREKAPPFFQNLVLGNPIARLVEESRQCAVAGQNIDWFVYGWLLLSGLLVSVLGYAIFMRAKPLFADVL